MSDAMENNHLSIVIDEINCMIDSGEFDDISLTEVKQRVRDGTIIAAF